MKRIEVNNVKDIASMMFHAIAIDNKRDVSFVGSYEDIIKIFKGLCKYEEIDLEYVELELPDVTGYEKEYILSLTESMTLFCQKAFDKVFGDYIFDHSDVLFIADDCNSKIMQNIKGNEKYEIGLKEPVEMDLCNYCCCNDCRLCEFD